MKNIKKTTDDDLTVFSVTGTITVKELIEVVIDFYKDSTTPNIIWDFTKSDLTGLREKDLENIAFVTLKYSENRPSGKTAIVSNSDEMATRLTKFYEEKISYVPLPFVTKSFSDMDKAYGWIHSK